MVLSTKKKTSCRTHLNVFMQLFQKPFKYRVYSEKEKSFLYVMQTRAWGFHCIYTLWRIISWSSGKSLWLNDDCIDKNIECPEYDREIIDEITPMIRLYIGVSIVLALILDIFSYKYRQIAQSFIYIESFNTFMYSLVPSKYYMEMSMFFAVIIFIVHFGVFYCDTGA